MWRRQLEGSGLDRLAGILFMAGSLCFGLGSVPPYYLNVDAAVVGITFFVGSIFFTSAGVTQLRQARSSPDRRIWWPSLVQLVGMVFFNINTYRAAFVTVPPDEVNALVWAPDLYGSICFLVASHLAWRVTCGRLWCVRRDDADWWMAALNYLGSIFFMAAALGAFTLPTTGEAVNIAIVNSGTLLGAACFFTGAYLLLPPRPAQRSVA